MFRLIDNEQPKMQPKLAAGELDWTSYHDLTAIYAWVDALVAEFPNYLSVEDIGYSYENRRIRVVKLSKNPSAVLEITLNHFEFAHHKFDCFIAEQSRHFYRSKYSCA